ncbi:MAG: flavin monoamine oxidase family protein [Actinomycetota bacterium]
MRVEERDAVVVGAGIAGLAAAWELRDLDVVLVEAADRVGGRIRSVERGPLWLNLGAHVYGGPTTEVGRLLRETGVEAVEVPGTVTAMSYKGRLLSDGPVEFYPFRLPFSLADRLAFVRVGLKLRRLVARYGRVAQAVPGEAPEVRQQRMLDFMDDVSFAEAIGPMPPDVEAFFRCTVTRSTGEPEAIAAGYGVGYFHLVWNKDQGLGRSIVGGPQRLMDGLAAGVRDVRLATRATAVRRDGDRVVVELEGPEGPYAVRARSVVMATTSHRTADLVEGLPADLEAALRAITYGPLVAAAFLTDEEGPQPWDRLYGISAPRRAISNVFNLANVAASLVPERPRGSSFMVSAAADIARDALRLSDEEILDRFQTDLEEILPGVRGHVIERLLHRADPGIPFPHPGRAAIQPALMQPLERIHLAGDYLGMWYAETSAWTGVGAARRARAEISAG